MTDINLFFKLEISDTTWKIKIIETYLAINERLGYLQKRIDDIDEQLQEYSQEEGG